MAFDVKKATGFIESIDLRGTPRSIIGQDAADDAGVVFDKAKSQAQVVGSGLFSFATGVDAEVREAISDSALLAQLHANKQVKFEDDPQKWFSTYAEVLANVGWDIQDRGWSDYQADGTDAEVNEKIVDLLTVALGAGATALAVVTSMFAALKGMNPSSPWISLFSREVQKGSVARFQIGLVSVGHDDQVLVNLIACILSADNALTQVLFFKWHKAHAKFRADSMTSSINRASLSDLGPAIRAKTRAYQADYLSSIKDV